MNLGVSLVLAIAIAATGQGNRTVERSTVTIEQPDRAGGVSVRRNGEPMIEGSGRLVRQTRTVGRFDAIELSGAANLDIAIGAAMSVEIEADDNLIGLLTTEVEGGKLVIDTNGSFRTRTAPRVRITLPRLASIETTGSGDAAISGVAGGRLSLAARGSGDFSVEGRGEALDADMYGSGRIDLDRFVAPDLSVSIYGSGNARLRVTEALHATVYGTGDIDYRGDRDRIRVRSSVFGTGRIRHLGS